MSRISRREFVATLSALGLSPAAFALDRETRADHGSRATFAHGVASGDPLHDRVILWTRVTPQRFADEVLGKWRIATDRAHEARVQWRALRHRHHA